MPDLLEVFTQPELLSYAENRVYPPLLGESIFPPEKRDGFEFDVIKGSRKVPVAASIHAWDTESMIVTSTAAKGSLELALFKQKQQIREKDIVRLNTPRTPAEQALVTREIFNLVDKTREGVRAGIEVVRMGALAKGLVYIPLENGQVLEIDYGVPDENQLILSGTALWSNPDADILGDLARMKDATGLDLVRALTSPEILADILANNAIRDNMFRFSTLNVIPTRADLNAFLADRELPQIIVSRGYYDEKQKNGTLKRKRYFDRDYFVAWGETVELGNTIFGNTPEEIRLVSRTDITTEQVGNVLSMVYESSVDPVSSWTKSVALALPSFPGADEVIQIKAGNRGSI